MTFLWWTVLVLCLVVGGYLYFWFWLHHDSFGAPWRVVGCIRRWPIEPSEKARATVAGALMVVSAVGAWIVVVVALSHVQVELPRGRVTPTGWAGRLTGNISLWAKAAWTASGDLKGDTAPAWQVWSVGGGWPDSEEGWRKGALLLRATGSDLIAEIATADGKAPAPLSDADANKAANKAGNGGEPAATPFSDVVLAISPGTSPPLAVSGTTTADGSSNEAASMIRRTAILSIADGGLTGMRTVGLRLDEEAVAAWYLDGLDSISNTPLGDEDKARAIRFISDLLRFSIGEARGQTNLAMSRSRTGGDGEESTGGSNETAGGAAELIRPREAASTLRWPIWVHGSNPAASTIHFLIYWAAGLALFQIGFRFLFVGRPDFVKWLGDRVRGEARSDGDAQVKPLETALRELDIRVCYQNSVNRLRNGADGQTAACEATLARWDSRRWFVTALEAIIPALGFVGTIWGLGEAFGSVGIISKIESIQRESLMKVLLDLGTAFSTTFVALILSGLVVIPINMFLCGVEDRVLFRKARSDPPGEQGGDAVEPEPGDNGPRPRRSPRRKGSNGGPRA